LCLLAAIEFEKRKQRKKDDIDAKRKDIQKEISELESYRDNCKLRQITCYDAFKLHNNRQDFKANVNRLELASIWDEIIEMVKTYQLPDDFEGQEDWVELGTTCRRLVEPLDVANYYRHSKDEESGPYLGTPGKRRKPRPKRYIYPQRWLEHAKKLTPESSGESHFWAEVEELRTKTTSNEGFERVKPRVLQLEKNIQKWVKGRELGMDVLLEESILRKWWETLPEQHKKDSCIQELIDEEKEDKEKKI
jgi:enhanced disease susceptibility 1 protein